MLKKLTINKSLYMSDSQPLIPEKLNYSHEIENIKKEVAVNKQVEGWIDEATKKTKREMEDKLNARFWNGFLFGIIIAIIIMFFWKR
jgi:hypothetical protein